jgi:FixJ family two-component response regulator
MAWQASGSGHEFSPREVCPILVVDDDQSVREGTRTLLRSVGYPVRTFASAESVLEADVLGCAACLILDVRMPGMDGLELQRRVLAAGIRVPIVFITAHDDVLVRIDAIAAGAVAVLSKPFEANDLLAIVQVAMKGRPQ